MKKLASHRINWEFLILVIITSIPLLYVVTNWIMLLIGIGD